MSGMVLVDTSVFVDFLRGKTDDVLSVLILNNQVLLSQVVRIELLAGVGKRDAKILSKLLLSLRVIPTFPSPGESVDLLEKVRSKGRYGGFADLLILADAVREKASLLTSDHKMALLAKQLRVPALMQG